MKFLSTRVATITLVALITVFSIHLFDRWLRDARVDLTQDDLYSLSTGSKSILERMSEEGVEPVDITLYFSETSGKTLPRFIKDFISYERYLRSLLRQYERRSNGKVTVDFIDPVTDSDEAQEAADAGLDGKLINEEGDRFYFGLTFETQTGSRETLEFLWPQEQENIEYEISKTLTNLLWPTRQRVGVLSSLEVFGSADDPYLAQMMAAQGRQPTQEWVSVQLLRETYDVTKVPADTEEISALGVRCPGGHPSEELAQGRRSSRSISGCSRAAVPWSSSTPTRSTTRHRRTRSSPGQRCSTSRPRASIHCSRPGASSCRPTPSPVISVSRCVARAPRAARRRWWSTSRSAPMTSPTRPPPTCRSSRDSTT